MLDWRSPSEPADAAAAAAALLPPEVDAQADADSSSSIGLSHRTFTKYVENKDDLVGFVAYSIYKQHKISFLEREYQKTKQRASQDKVDAFCESYCHPEQVELLKERAEKLIQNMHQLLVVNAIDTVRAEEQAKYVKQLEEGPGWWDSIGKSIAGNLATAALVALVIFGGSVVSNGFWETVGNWTGMKIAPKSASPSDKKSDTAPAEAGS